MTQKPQQKICDFMSEKCKQISEKTSKLMYSEVTLFLFTPRDASCYYEWSDFEAEKVVSTLIKNLQEMPSDVIGDSDICPHCIYHSQCCECEFASFHMRCNYSGSDYNKLKKLLNISKLVSYLEPEKLLKVLQPPEKWAAINIYCSRYKKYTLGVYDLDANPKCSMCGNFLEYENF